jgi:NAD(P)-dependent dehydrogenase (short-subunit alcohol dehydrogenase family)
VAAPDFTRLAPRAGARIALAGGAGGFGRALTAACLANGLQVAVLDLPASLARHPPPSPVPSLALDGIDPASVSAAFAELGRRWGGLDAFVHLIGFAAIPPAPLDAVEPPGWAEIVEGNLTSAYLCCRAALPLLRRAGGGTIVVVSSGLGFNVLPGFGAYAAAKAGLIGLTKTLAAENAPAIRANAVAPSAAHTAFMGGGTGRGGDEPGSADWLQGRTLPLPPLGRFCEPEDVVGPILFLAGEASRFMTGQVLHVSGGRFTP